MNEARSGEDAGASKTSGVHEAAGQLNYRTMFYKRRSDPDDMSRQAATPAATLPNTILATGGRHVEFGLVSIGLRKIS